MIAETNTQSPLARAKSVAELQADRDRRTQDRRVILWPHGSGGAEHDARISGSKSKEVRNEEPPAP